jgi:hypothetical protein
MTLTCWIKNEVECPIRKILCQLLPVILWNYVTDYHTKYPGSKDVDIELYDIKNGCSCQYLISNMTYENIMINKRDNMKVEYKDMQKDNQTGIKTLSTIGAENRY